MALRCESCSTPLPPDQQWKSLCTACWAASKRALPAKKPAEPAPKPDLNSELRARLDAVSPRRPAPFGSLRELIDFLMSSEIRAASAEQSVVRLEKRIAALEAENARLKHAADDF
jgi:hypothetical protein